MNILSKWTVLGSYDARSYILLLSTQDQIIQQKIKYCFDKNKNKIQLLLITIPQMSLGFPASKMRVIRSA